MPCMPNFARRVTRYFGLCVWVWVSTACSASTNTTVEPGETLAELRLIKGEARITSTSKAPRPPSPRERLSAGQGVILEPGALLWMRRDGGATWLVSGPAELELQPSTLTAKRGRFFADTEHGEPATLATPRGSVTLGSARASVEVDQEGVVKVYALRGETRFSSGGHLTPGEELTWRPGTEPHVAPALTWQDWTGGLAVADSAATPAPFGIGTVGARKPEQTGTPRFPLSIERLDVKVTIDGDFALTEVDQTFENPTTETVEGLFGFRTPRGAMLQRFGVDRDDGLVWGRIKESATAETRYESNVYQGSVEQPALLSWQEPGVYAARLYPIAGRSKRRVVTRYSEWLQRNGERGERRLYVYPMAAQGAKGSLPTIEELSITVDLSAANASGVRVGLGTKVVGAQVVMRAADVVPQADFAVELFDAGTNGVTAYQAPHNLLMAETPPGQPSQTPVARDEPSYVAFPIRIPRRVESPLPATESEAVAASNGTGVDLAIVVDTSAATEPSALVLARSLASSLLSHLGAGDRVALWTGDATLHPVTPDAGELTTVSDVVREHWLAGLAAAQLGGASDLGALLQAAANKLDPHRRGAVVYIGDGTPSVGELVPKALAERLARLPTGTRIFSAALGSDPNLPVLEAVTRGGDVFTVHDGHSAGRAALGILESAQRFTWLDAKLDLGPGVERVFPRTLPPLTEDSTFVVVGRLTGTLPSKVTLNGSGGTLELPVTTRVIDDRGDLRRRWGHARFSELMSTGAGRAELVDVAHRSGVVTPVTSLYVATRREEANEGVSETQRENAYAEQRAKERRWQPWRDGDFADSLAQALGIFRGASEPDPLRVETRAATADNKEGGSGVPTRYAGAEGRGDGPVRAPSSLERATPADPTFAKGAPPSGLTTETQWNDDIGESPTRLASASEPSVLLKRGSRAAPVSRPASAVARKPQTSTRRVEGGPLNGDMDGYGDAPYQGGLGLSGVGAGGGGVGLGSIGTLGVGVTRQTGSGPMSGSHRTSSPAVRQGSVTVSGRLPLEVVQRISRQNFGRFRLCYERGLTRNPDLTGRVEVNFTIDATGSVRTSRATARSTLPDSEVRACVSEAFHGVTFPPPESGPATVVYSVLLGAEEPSAVVPSATPSTGVLGTVGHSRLPCGPGAALPLEERAALWRERVRNVTSAWASVDIYARALLACEAPSYQDRTRLLVLLVNQLGSVRDRVTLWRRFLELSPRAADVIYRSLLLRVQTAADLKELHSALGLSQVAPELLERLLKRATNKAERARLLRGVATRFSNDTELALDVLDAYEDAGDEASGRTWARSLRRRVDGTSHLRMHVGEYYLRLASRAETPEAAAADTAEARRTFGELVEFAPHDPLARRQLGDVLRAHGWFDEAQRQYETLLTLTPNDPAIPLLLAATAAGRGKTQEAITWLERATASTSAQSTNPLFTATRALASAYLARARLTLGTADTDASTTLERLRARAIRWLSAPNSDLRVLVTWAHPELHPTLWTNQAGTMLLAPDNHALLGVAQGYTSLQTPEFSLRLTPEDAAQAARLRLNATLTVILNEGQPDEKIANVEVTFGAHDTPRERTDYRWQDGALVEVKP